MLRRYSTKTKSPVSRYMFLTIVSSTLMIATRHMTSIAPSADSDMYRENIYTTINTIMPAKATSPLTKNVPTATASRLCSPWKR